MAPHEAGPAGVLTVAGVGPEDPIGLGRPRGVDLEPDRLSVVLVTLAPPVMGHGIDQGQTPSSRRQLSVPLGHRQAGVQVGNGDAQAGTIEGKDEVERRSGVTDGVGDELGHEEGDGVLQPTEPPFGQR